MEAVHTSETSVYSNESTRRYISESSHLHTRRRQNLKSHTILSLTTGQIARVWFSVEARHHVRIGSEGLRDAYSKGAEGMAARADHSLPTVPRSRMWGEGLSAVQYSGGVALPILNLGSRWRQLHNPAALILGTKPQVHCGPQSLSGQDGVDQVRSNLLSSYTLWDFRFSRWSAQKWRLLGCCAV
jgi:hypothetical protein